MTVPDAPHAIVPRGSDAQKGLSTLGWTVTGGWNPAVLFCRTAAVEITSVDDEWVIAKFDDQYMGRWPREHFSGDVPAVGDELVFTKTLSEAPSEQSSWVRMEPPRPRPTGAAFRDACADLVPELHWKSVGAGIGPTCWGFRSPDDPLDSKVAALSGGGKFFIAWGLSGEGEGVKLAHTGSFREAAQAIRTHLGLDEAPPTA